MVVVAERNSSRVTSHVAEAPSTRIPWTTRRYRLATLPGDAYRSQSLYPSSSVSCVRGAVEPPSVMQPPTQRPAALASPAATNSRRVIFMIGILTETHEEDNPAAISDRNSHFGARRSRRFNCCVGRQVGNIQKRSHLRLSKRPQGRAPGQNENCCISEFFMCRSFRFVDGAGDCMLWP